MPHCKASLCGILCIHTKNRFRIARQEGGQKPTVVCRGIGAALKRRNAVRLLRRIPIQPICGCLNRVRRIRLLICGAAIPKGRSRLRCSLQDSVLYLSQHGIRWSIREQTCGTSRNGNRNPIKRCGICSARGQIPTASVRTGNLTVWRARTPIKRGIVALHAGFGTVRTHDGCCDSAPADLCSRKR